MLFRSSSKRIEDRIAEGLGTFVFDGKKDCKDRGRSCRWGGPCATTPNPVLMSLCIPLKNSEETWWAFIFDEEYYKLDCKYRVCFDARAVLESWDKSSMTNPLLKTHEGKNVFTDKEIGQIRKSGVGVADLVDAEFFKMLELAVCIHDCRKKLGILNMEGVDRSFVRNFMAKAISENLDKFWGPKIDKAFGYLNLTLDKIKTMIKRYGHYAIFRVPIFGILLPILADLFLLVICMFINGET